MDPIYSEQTVQDEGEFCCLSPPTPISCASWNHFAGVAKWPSIVSCISHSSSSWNAFHKRKRRLGSKPKITPLPPCYGVYHWGKQKSRPICIQGYISMLSDINCYYFLDFFAWAVTDCYSTSMQLHLSPNPDFVPNFFSFQNSKRNAEKWGRFNLYNLKLLDHSSAIDFLFWSHPNATKSDFRFYA